MRCEQSVLGPFAEFAFPCPCSQIKQVKDFLWLLEGAASTTLLFQGLPQFVDPASPHGENSCGNNTWSARAQIPMDLTKAKAAANVPVQGGMELSLIKDFLEVLTHRKQTLDQQSLNPLKKKPYCKHHTSKKPELFKSKLWISSNLILLMLLDYLNWLTRWLGLAYGFSYFTQEFDNSKHWQ